METWHRRIDERRVERLIIRSCHFCGKRKVVFLQRGEQEWDRINWVSTTYIAGGRTPEGYEVCDVCLEMGSRIDELQRLEERIKKARSELKKLKERISNLMVSLRAFSEVDEVNEKRWIVAVRQRDSVSTLDWFRVFRSEEEAINFHTQMSKLLPPIYEIYLAKIISLRREDFFLKAPDLNS